MAAELVRQLHGLGVTVDVAVFDNDGRGDRRILAAVQAHVRRAFIIPCRRQFDFAAIRNLRQAFRNGEIDVVHSHKYKTTFYSLLACVGLQSRLVATYHNWLTDTPALRLYSALDKRLARYCQAAVGVSAPVVDELRRYVPADRVYRIDNGIDTDYYLTRRLPKAEAMSTLGVADDRLVIGFVGRLSAQKGVPLLFKATACLPSVLRDRVVVVIAGDGEARAALVDDAAAMGIANQVRFLGTRDDVATVYSAMDIFVLPSEVEAFPMVVLEAMACRVPVIATAVGDVPRIVRNGESGYVIAKGDVKALRDRMTELLMNRPLAERMSQAAGDLALEYSSRRTAQSYLDVYRRALA